MYPYLCFRRCFLPSSHRREWWRDGAVWEFTHLYAQDVLYCRLCNSLCTYTVRIILKGEYLAREIYFCMKYDTFLICMTFDRGGEGHLGFKRALAPPEWFCRCLYWLFNALIHFWVSYGTVCGTWGCIIVISGLLLSFFDAQVQCCL